MPLKWLGGGEREERRAIKIILIFQRSFAVLLICRSRQKSFVAFPDCKLRGRAVSIKNWILI